MLITHIVGVVDKNGKVVAAIISNDSTTDSIYCIAVSKYTLADSKIGADLWMGTDKDTANGVTIDDANVVADVSVAVKGTQAAPVLYKIKKTTNGDYTITKIVTESGKWSATTASALAYKNGYLYDAAGTTIVGSLASDVIVYVFDKSDNAFSIGSRTDITSDDTKDISLYIDDDSDHDTYGQIKYVTVWKE